MNIEELRAATQDEGTRQWIVAVRIAAVPRLRRYGWTIEVDGDDGLGCWRGRLARCDVLLIHSIACCKGDVWSHVSLSRRDKIMPTWEQTRDAHRIIHPEHYGMIVVAPEEHHVNIAEVAHVWTCLSRQHIPDFTHGTASI